MKILVIFIITIFYSSVNLAKVEYYGTEAREEKEFKISFKLSKSEKIENISLSIQKALFDLINVNGLNVNKVIKSDYYLTGKLEPYLFLDYYFDTETYSLLKKNRVYRLRYRWRNEAKFEAFSTDFKKRNFPIRAEIQAKTKIKFLNSGLTSSMESRFEFRDESKPFFAKKQAPPAPWPLKEYLKYTNKGKYQSYPLLPFFEVTKGLNSNENLSPKIVVKTLRRRFHLNIKNKWGRKPNEDQSFIITLDTYGYSKYKNLTSAFHSEFVGPFYEIEIEFERNTSTGLSKDLSKEAKAVFEKFSQDHTAIRNAVKATLLKLNIKMDKQNYNKYKRVHIDFNNKQGYL
jgi:hypothetical protein